VKIAERWFVMAGVALLGAIAAAGAGLTSLGLALLLGVIVLALAGRLPPDAYRDIDWPVILLLAALIPVATAFGQSSIAGELAGALANRRHVVVLRAAVIAEGDRRRGVGVGEPAGGVAPAQ
jgi:di/tricarboxylate transporter